MRIKFLKLVKKFKTKYPYGLLKTFSSEETSTQLNFQDVNVVVVLQRNRDNDASNELIFHRMFFT